MGAPGGRSGSRTWPPAQEQRPGEGRACLRQTGFQSLGPGVARMTGTREKGRSWQNTWIYEETVSPLWAPGLATLPRARRVRGVPSPPRRPAGLRTRDRGQLSGGLATAACGFRPGPRQQTRALPASQLRPPAGAPLRTSDAGWKGREAGEGRGQGPEPGRVSLLVPAGGPLSEVPLGSLCGNVPGGP